MDARDGAAARSRGLLAALAVACGLAAMLWLAQAPPTRVPLVRPTERRCDVLGAEVRYQEYIPAAPAYAWNGDAVLLHASTESAAVWEAVGGLLATREGGLFRVLALEVPRRRRDSLTHAEWLRACLQVIRGQAGQRVRSSHGVAARKSPKKNAALVAAGDAAQYVVPLLWETPRALSSLVLAGDAARYTTEYFDSQFAALDVHILALVGERDQSTLIDAKKTL